MNFFFHRPYYSILLNSRGKKRDSMDSNELNKLILDL